MKPFIAAHATHPDAHLALALVAAQIDAQLKQDPQRPTLGWLYFSDAFLPKAEGLLSEMRLRWPGVSWVGASGVGICAGGVEYFEDHEPALAVMLGELPADQFRVFSGARPLGRAGSPALMPELIQVHADGSSHDLQDLLVDLAGNARSGYLFGGIASGRRDAAHIADGVWRGGLSGVAFMRGMRVLSRVSQGCQALGPERRISACDGPLVTELDGRAALDCLLEDLALPVLSAGADLREAVPRFRQTLIGLNRSAAPANPARQGSYGEQVQVRHLVGIDPQRRGVVVAERVQVGEHLSFCERNPKAARRDLLRICTELRSEAEDQAAEDGTSAIAGAVYISCAGRGGPHFGAPSAEAQWVKHGLGDVPLVGFFAGGEIAHAGLHGYTGVLTVFMRS